MVITGRKVLRIVAVISFLVAIAVAAISIVRGVEISDMLINNLPIWIGVVATGVITLAIPPEKKDKKDNE